MKSARSCARRSPSRLASAALLLGVTATPVFAQDADDTPRVRLLALDGDDIADAEPGETLVTGNLRDTMAAGANGVFFLGGSYSTGQTTRSGFFTAGAGGTKAVLVREDELPSTGGVDVTGLTVNFLDAGRMVPNGDILLKPLFFEDSSNVAAQVVQVGGMFGTALSERRTVPGLDTISHLPDDFDTALGGGTLVGRMRATIDGDVTDVVIRRVGFGDAEIIAADEGEVPGLGGAKYLDPFGAVSVADDGSALFVAAVDTPGRLLVHIAAPPSTQTTVLAASGDTVPGTGLNITSFGSTTMGAAGDGSIRSSWSVGTDGNAAYVLDTGHGTSPVLGTGTTVGDFSISADAPFEIAHTLADDGQLIAVADTAGPGIAVGRQGVWRHDPRLESPLALILYEGGPLPGIASDLRTITAIDAVCVARDGRIAAEARLSNNRDVLLLEHVDPMKRGQFIIVGETLGTLTTENGDRDLIQLIGGIRSRPELVGSGQDGRRSRFTPDGELVFFARTDTASDTTDRNGMFAVRIGPEPEVCDVKVRKRGRNLEVRGGDGDCRITLQLNDFDELTAIPGLDTTVNGETVNAAFTGIKGLSIRMSGGEDTVILDGRLSEGNPLPGNAVVDMGAGGDSFQVVSGFDINGSLTVKMGKPLGLDDRVVLDSSDVKRNLKISGGASRLVVDMERVLVFGRTSIALGGADSRLDGDTCVLGPTLVRGGRESEVLFFREMDFEESVVFDTGPGDLSWITIHDSRFEGRSARVKAKRATTPTIRFEDTVHDGGVRVDVGSGVSKVTVERGRLDGGIMMTTAGAASGGPHDLSVRNTLCDTVRIRGGGSVTAVIGAISVVDRGVDVSLRPGAAHSVSMFDLEVLERDVRIRAPATNAFVSLARLQIRQGGLSVSASRGDDDVFVRDSTIGGRFKINTLGGDDELGISGLSLLSGARINAAGGTDTLEIDAATRDNADGSVVVLGVESETEPTPE